MVWLGLVWFGFECFGTWVMSRCFYMLEKHQSYGRFKDIWVGLVWLGLVWSGMVDGYCLDKIPCKIWKSYFEKQLSYGQYIEIWFGLV